jgi:hypothetical protein
MKSTLALHGKQKPKEKQCFPPRFLFWLIFFKKKKLPAPLQERYLMVISGLFYSLLPMALQL